MKIQNSNEVWIFLGAAVFFGLGMLTLNPQYVTVSSAWDYIVLQLLTFMNGLGLCLVLGLLVSTFWSGKVSKV